jgi:hypothetical protein
MPNFDIDTEVVLVSTYLPDSDQPSIIVMLLAFKETEDDARRALQPAEDSFPGEPAAHWSCQETSLEKEYANQARSNPSGHRYLCDNAFIHNDADVVKILEKALTTIPSKQTYTFWYPMHPWSRQDLPDMALSLQTDHYLALYTIWEDEKDDARCQSWVRDIMKDVKKHSVGSYLGDIDLQVRTTKFWGDAQGEKLMKVRREWDPNGIICGYLDAGDKSGVTGLDNKLDLTLNSLQ